MAGRGRAGQGMNMKRSIQLRNDVARRLAASYCLQAADNIIVQFREPTRTVQQNNLMWSRLGELSKAVQWDGQTLTPSEWKDLLSACLRKQKVVRGIEGGLVFLGAKTSAMTAREMGELLDLMDAFAAERGVIFTEKKP